MPKEVNFKIIQSYDDLKNSKPGEFILIKGRTELVLNPKDEDVKEFEYNPDSIITISLERDYVVKNHYTLALDNAFSHKLLDPFTKISCKQGSGTGLEYCLSKIAKKGGLLK
jgi:hypothetical protein